MKSFLHNTWKHRAHVVMALPAFLILFFIMYVPMAGLVMAFKNFDYTLGIWKSPWNGIDNFKFLLASKATFVTMTRNTLLYYIVFTALGTFLNVVLAIAIDQFVFKKMAKTMHPGIYFLCSSTVYCICIYQYRYRYHQSCNGCQYTILLNSFLLAGDLNHRKNVEQCRLWFCVVYVRISRY